MSDGRHCLLQYYNVLAEYFTQSELDVTFLQYDNLKTVETDTQCFILIDWHSADEFERTLIDIKSRPDIPVLFDYSAESTVYDWNLLRRIRSVTDSKVIVLTGNTYPVDAGMFYVLAQKEMKRSIPDLSIAHSKVKTFSNKPRADRVALTYLLSQSLSPDDFMYSNNPTGSRGLTASCELLLRHEYRFNAKVKNEIVKFSNQSMVMDTTDYDFVANVYPRSMNCDVVVYSETGRKHLFVTEKTYKCFYAMVPFLVLASQGFLKHLRSIGFKTFDGIIDETYDTLTDRRDRINAIVNETQRLVSSPDYHNKIEQCKTICNHNHDHMHELDTLRQFSKNMILSMHQDDFS